MRVVETRVGASSGAGLKSLMRSRVDLRSARQITLEITERLLAEDSRQMVEQLDALGAIARLIAGGETLTPSGVR
jgi:hypothetical protein